MFGVVDGFDNVFVVSRKIEEASALAWRTQLGKDILAGKGHQIIGRVKSELCSQTSKNPRRIVLEFEVIFGRRSQFITGSNNSVRIRTTGSREYAGIPYISKENLCLASKSAGVSSRSIFALILDTVNRIPVSILYAVTQLTWL